MNGSRMVLIGLVAVLFPVSGGAAEPTPAYVPECQAPYQVACFLVDTVQENCAQVFFIECDVHVGGCIAQCEPIQTLDYDDDLLEEVAPMWAVLCHSQGLTFPIVNSATSAEAACTTLEFTYVSTIKGPFIFPPDHQGGGTVRRELVLGICSAEVSATVMNIGLDGFEARWPCAYTVGE